MFELGIRRNRYAHSGRAITVNKQLKLLTCFVVFMLVTQIAPLSFGSSQVKAGNSKLITDASSFTFGNTAIGTDFDSNDPNAQSISYFTCTTTGSITDIMAYIDGASSGNAITALYAVSGSSAGALLEQSNAVNIGTTFSWVDFQLPTPYTVTAGTTYGLAIMGNVPVNLALVSGTGQRTGGPGYGSYTNGFTNPFGTIWFNDLTGAMSIYASGILVSSQLSVTISPTSAN